MKFVVEICPPLMDPKRNEATGSPVVALLNAPVVEGKDVSLVEKFISPCGKGTWKKGNWIGRNSAPNLNEWVPLVTATFWMKSQTLLYSLVGSQPFAPTCR